MTFFMQMRPALYVALIALSPLVLRHRPNPAGATLLLEAAGPARSPAMTRMISSRTKARLRAGVAMLAIAAQLVTLAGPAAAFCGFYVAKADCQAVQQVVQGRAGARRRHHRHHDGERLRGRAEGIRRRHPGADLHRAEADRRGRDEDHRPSRRLHGAAAGRVSRRGPVLAAGDGAAPGRPAARAGGGRPP